MSTNIEIVICFSFLFTLFGWTVIKPHQPNVLRWISWRICKMFCGRKFPEELKTQISSVKMILTASSSTVNIAKLPAVGTSLYLPHKEDQAIDSLRATLADYDIASSDYNNVNDWHKFCCRLESCQSIKMAKIIGEEFQNESQ